MMNDLTKEELIYLHGAIYERPNCVTEQMDKVRDKIQSLIDNYCEHVNAIIDEKLKCIYCGHPSTIEVTKYKGLKRVCDE